MENGCDLGFPADLFAGKSKRNKDLVFEKIEHPGTEVALPIRATLQ